MRMRLTRRLARETPRHARQAASLIAAGAVGAFLLGGPSDTAAAQATAGHGTPFKGSPPVGALFIKSNGRLGPHFCTASVVHSPHENLVITAAHCMAGKNLRPAGHIVFAPGYHRGKFPHGLWQVHAKFVDKRWASDHDPNDDIAFLVVGRPGRRIEKFTGTEALVTSHKLPTQVQVIGYPDATERPITCGGPAISYNQGKLRQLEFDCDGYTNGTSGGPFLADVSAKTGEGSVIGVIGGYQEGGNTPSVSYSSKFLANVRALYKIATAAPATPGSG
jgi:V8-like Glu-specific endopeptidase